MNKHNHAESGPWKGGNKRSLCEGGVIGTRDGLAGKDLDGEPSEG